MKKVKSVQKYFSDSPTSLQSVFGCDKNFWSERLKTALSLMGVAGFPYQLSPVQPIPALPITEATPSLKKIFSSQINIYLTPDNYFVTKFCDIF